jgi:hypothetical protein
MFVLPLPSSPLGGVWFGCVCGLVVCVVWLCVWFGYVYLPSNSAVLSAKKAGAVASLYAGTSLYCTVENRVLPLIGTSMYHTVGNWVLPSIGASLYHTVGNWVLPSIGASLYHTVGN